MGVSIYFCKLHVLNDLSILLTFYCLAALVLIIDIDRERLGSIHEVAASSVYSVR